MLDALITSKTRVRLLVKFFLNPTMKAYLRELASEFNESTNSVRLELNRLKDAGLLESYHEGNTVIYQAKQEHPLFPEIRKIVTKVTGIDSVVESLIERIGNMQQAYLVGDYAKGKDSGLIDVVLIGELDKSILQEAIDTAEALINRKIRTLVLTKKEFEANTLKKNEPFLLLWSKK
ncbi:MAG: ArsR family transcriptional regulator [Flavobacteriales bacterium]|nr:MAG: ArsR family transcriptional regulator [Flavobacteriales bacterium]